MSARETELREIPAKYYARMNSSRKEADVVFKIVKIDAWIVATGVRTRQDALAVFGVLLVSGLAGIAIHRPADALSTNPIILRKERIAALGKSQIQFYLDASSARC